MLIKTPSVRRKKRSDQKLIKKILQVNPANAEDVAIVKSVLGDIQIDFKLEGYEVYMRVDQLQHVTFFMINFNYYLDFVDEKERKQLDELAMRFFKTSKDRLRLLY